ncbi:MAG: DNA polymerase III subunit delta' [Microcystaceae cyanobacterium]
MADFRQLLGQPQAIALLTQAIEQRRIAPAYLFVGVDGIGKGLAAREFAKLLLTLGLSSEKQAIAAQKALDGNHPDLLWVEPTYQHQGQLLTAKEANEKGLNRKTPPQVRLEQVRQISQFLSRPPLEASRSVVVMEASQTMNEAAANGLLKTLEEPGQATLILLAPSGDVLLPTLISRCQRIPFYRLSLAQMSQILQRQGYQEIIERPEILAIAQGSPGEAIRALAQWRQLPDTLREALEKPISHPLTAFRLGKTIAQTLDSEVQLWLIDYLQQSYWRTQPTRDNLAVLEALENARKALLSYVQPRLVWECTLLQITNKSNSIGANWH